MRLTDSTPEAGIGGKANHVRWLIGQGVPVPATWVIAFDQPAVFEPEGPGPFAVRSSASVEDGAEHSYAGQFATLLDVQPPDLESAIETVRASTDSQTARAYADQVESVEIRMAVMVQDMVSPVVSGVVFSRNPVTGLNEVVLEAIEGRGDRLVGEGVTPWRWVRRGADWTEQPEESTAADQIVEQVVAECRRLAAVFGAPLDLEWVWDGNQVWWVQARPITGIADVGVYSNRISREVMPGMIKPLVWSTNVPVVNGAWIDLFSEVLGSHDIQVDDLAKSFAYRSYFNMGTIGRIFELMGMPRDSLEMLLGLPGTDKPSFKPNATTLKLMPRMTAAGIRLARFERRIKARLPELETEYRRYAGIDLASLTDPQLLDVIDELADLGKSMAYFNIVTPLLANLHSSLLRRKLEKAGLDYAEVDVAADVKDRLAHLDPNLALAELATAFDALESDVRSEVLANGLSSAPAEFQRDLDGFLGSFGHFSDSGNDFSVTPWRENPELILAVISADRNEQTASPKSPSEGGGGVGLPRRFGSSVKRAAKYQLHRESVSFSWTFGYGLFRGLYLEIGRRLVATEQLAAPDDVMYLTRTEVAGSLLDGLDHQVLIENRKREMNELADVEMPEVIYGDDFVPTRVSANATELKGIPTSRGSHRGTIRVIRGLEEFDRVKPGDIIAIPFSDVGWTPLFARAGAVVAASGGVLSHSSIVAREYGIPCVVSVEGAMRLPDGATAVVNGYTGDVVVDEL